MILEIDQAIGRCLGWEIQDRPVTRHGRLLPYKLPRCRNPKYCHGRWKPLSHYPSFSSNLNAMHKAVTSLPNHSQWLWFAKLADIVNAQKPAALGTAHDWAEAFLKVVERWDETYRL